MNNIKYLFICILYSSTFTITLYNRAEAQEVIKIDSCYKWAQEHYPLTKQYNLLEQTKDLTLDNINTANLPRIQVFGQATYQSDVTEIPIRIPDMDIPSISKDQYKAYGEITQPLTQFKISDHHKELANITHDIQKQELTISLRHLKDRVHKLFFGILLTETQIEQTRITITDLENSLSRLNTALKNGTALPSNLDQLKAELLLLNQKTITLESQRSQLIRILKLLTGREMDKTTQFVKPELPIIPKTLQRPELYLYTLQKSGIEQENALFHQKIKPQASLFLQSGIGRPALNFLDNDFRPYFLGGLRFQWNISAYYNRKRMDEISNVQKRDIELRNKTFKLNTYMQIEQYNEEVQRYRDLIKSDQGILELRSSIKTSAEHQLAQGVITPVDYLTLVHQEEQARQSRALHEILLLQSLYDWLYENGN